MGFYTCFVGYFNACEEGIKNDRILYSEIYSISQDEVLISLQRRRSLIYIPLTQDIILISLRRRYSQRRTGDYILSIIDMALRDFKASKAYAS